VTVFLVIVALLLLIVGVLFLVYARKPVPQPQPTEPPLALAKRKTTFITPPPQIFRQQNLHSEIEQVTDAKLTWNLLANWWDKKKLESIVELVTLKAQAAEGFKKLQGMKVENRDNQLFQDVGLELRRLAKENEFIIQERANQLRIPVAQYGEYTLELLKYEIQKQAKIHEAEVKTHADRIEIEAVFRASIKKASLVFENQQRLITELSKLETNLENMETEAIPEIARIHKKKRLEQLISVKEAELRASQQETLPQGDGRGLGAISSETPDSSEPAE